MLAEPVVHFEDVLALAYRLSPLDKIKLVKRMADALEQEPALTTSSVIAPTQPSEPHWGQQLIALLDTFETNDWQAIDMPDVLEWLKEQRAQQDQKRRIFWEGME
jgi:hypothetical protein